MKVEIEEYEAMSLSYIYLDYYNNPYLCNGIHWNLFYPEMR